MSTQLLISITVNGIAHQVDVPVRLSLADFLRHELGLTGTHLGCEHGVCGACTVLLDGRSVRGCLMLAVQADGCNITTVEGLGDGDGDGDGESHSHSNGAGLSVLQQAFIDHHALQCGFCTPGMLTTLTELLANNPSPSEADVRLSISGNLCRCTGYAGIVNATLAAAALLRGESA
ncbi:MAG: aerobic-type carbon monoxide dehydrogenase small subunit (CoxS/CutS family) [Gammaproteobacteria bacterium]|jgi:aerobic-type carbon monoxide dehydrogenase small subunit (CoxS/CutS family)